MKTYIGVMLRGGLDAAGRQPARRRRSLSSKPGAASSRCRCRRADPRRGCRTATSTCRATGSPARPGRPTRGASIPIARVPEDPVPFQPWAEAKIKSHEPGGPRVEQRERHVRSRGHARACSSTTRTCT